jgi:Protein of unknown function (DUF1203)
MTEFIVHALPTGEPAPAGHHLVADDGSPCRRCLRFAEPGDELLLLRYDPFTVRSPYTGEGPVFVHANGCDAHVPEPGVVPEQVRAGRMFSVRGYDEDAMMLDAAVVSGDALADRARALLDEGAAFVHAHFAGAGCFAFRIDRA